MPGELLYLDSSAIVKLVVREPESEPLLAFLPAWPQRVTSEVAVVEVVRAARRATADAEVHRRARQVLAGFHLVRIDADVLDESARIDPPTLRALDAIHLASALSLAGDLAGLVAYDAALSEAAEARGVRVFTPS